MICSLARAGHTIRSDAANSPLPTDPLELTGRRRWPAIRPRSPRRRSGRAEHADRQGRSRLPDRRPRDASATSRPTSSKAAASARPASTRPPTTSPTRSSSSACSRRPGCDGLLPAVHDHGRHRAGPGDGAARRATRSYALDKDFTVVPLLGRGAVLDAPVVFVGYGISSDGAQVRRLRRRRREGQGRARPAVRAARRQGQEPLHEAKEWSREAGADHQGEDGRRSTGAVALLLVNPPTHHGEDAADAVLAADARASGRRSRSCTSSSTSPTNC